MNRRNFLGLSSLLGILPFCTTKSLANATKPVLGLPKPDEIVPTGIKELDKAIGGIRNGHMVTMSVATDWDVVSNYLTNNVNKAIKVVGYRTHDGDRLSLSVYCRKLLGSNVPVLLLIDDARQTNIEMRFNTCNVSALYLSDVYITCVDSLHQCVITKNRYGVCVKDDGVIDNRYTYPTFKLEC